MVEINIKKPEFIKLPRVQKVLTACLQCGYCIDVCEAHNQTPWESVTPRGKIYYSTRSEPEHWTACWEERSA